MDELIELEKKKRPPIEQVALVEPSVMKIKTWIEQVNSKKKGVKISRKDFVNWLIEKSADTLSNGDINLLIEKFYDEERFLREILRDVKRAKSNGRTDGALEIMIRPRKSESKKEPE